MDIESFLNTDGLFRTSYGDLTLTWRLLTTKEYKKFRALKMAGAVHPFILHSMVFERCLFGDIIQLKNELPAGLTISIGECIMWLSGDCQTTTILEDILTARQYYAGDSILEHMKAIVFTAFPMYVEEDVEKWTYPDLVRKFTIAEAILSKRMPGFKPLDPKDTYDASQPKKKPGVVDSADLRRENDELKKTMGDQNHPLDMHPDELARRQQANSNRLAPSVARKLDQRNRHRR